MLQREGGCTLTVTMCGLQSVGNLPSLFFSTAGKATPLIVLAAVGFEYVSTVGRAPLA